MKTSTFTNVRIIVLLIIVICLPGALHSQWGPRIKLSIYAMSANLNENMGPCLAVSGDTIHVVWVDHRTNGHAIYYKRSVDTGLTWNTEIPLTDTMGTAGFPAIAVSGSVIHVAWMDTSLGVPASFYKRSLDGGNTWGAAYCLDNNTKFWPGIAASGSMVVVSLNKGITSSNTEVFFRRSMDNGANWDAEQQISNADGRSEDPAIAAQGAYIHLAWNDNRFGNMQIYYRRSVDYGVTWGPETSLINAGAMSYSTMVCLNGPNADVPCGDTRAGTYDIWLKQSADYGSTWGADMQLTNISNVEAYPFMVRDGQKLHLVYLQLNLGGWYLYSGDGGTTWDPAVFLGNGGQPFIAYTGCVLHAICPDNGMIYYKRNPTGNCGSASGIAGRSGINASPLSLSAYTDQTGHVIMVDYMIAENSQVTLKLYDMYGREVALLANGEQQARNDYRVEFNASGLASGIYFCKLTGCNSTLVKKILLF